MRLKLHLDNQNGDEIIYPVYDIDFATVITTTGYHLNNHSVYASSGGQNYVGSSFYIANDNGAINRCFLTTPPTHVDDNNTKCIFPYGFRYDAELGGVWYPYGWFDSNIFEPYTEPAQPSDWNSNTGYKYVRFLADMTGYKTYTPHIPNSDTFVSGEVATDLKRYMCRKLFTNEGAHFVVCQGSSYSSGNIYPISYGLFDFLQTPSSAAQGDAYFHNKDNRPYQYSVVRGGATWGQTSTDIIHNGRPCVPVFVRYTIGVDECYGVCLIEYASANSDVIVRIDVSAVSTNSWGDSVISGGESGQGTWGNNATPSVNDGTFNSTSNNVGTTDTNYSTTAIQTRVNNSLSGLFSGLTGVYGIYMLDTASGTDRLFTELTKIYGVLYDTGTDAFLNRYLQSMYNPLSAVIAMHLLPYQFAASAIFGATTTKKLTISGYPVSDKIATKYSVTAPEYNILKPVGKVAFPTVSIPKILGGYADFAPYTQCILHLPFIGAIELKTNAIAHGEITVEYLCDIISGNVTARICCKDNNGNTQYVHSASGNCAYNLPLFTMSQDGAAVGKLLSGAAGIVTGALTGNPVNVATGAAGMVGAAIESSFSPRSTQISGNMGGNNMLMSNLDIWLEIIRPVWVQNMYYQKLNGIPSGMSNCIADCGQDASAGVAYDGYLQVESIDLDNVPCTEQEKREIETLLKQGVFIRGDEL